MRTLTQAVVAAGLAALLAQPAAANFVEVETGARAMGMGGAFIAVADDVTALHWNPAGLSAVDRVQVFGMRTSVYGVDEISEDSAAAAWGTGTRAFALGWSRTGAQDLYNEDTIVLGVGTTTPVEGLSAGVVIESPVTLTFEGMERVRERYRFDSGAQADSASTTYFSDKLALPFTFAV